MESHSNNDHDQLEIEVPIEDSDANPAYKKDAEGEVEERGPDFTYRGDDYIGRHTWIQRGSWIICESCPVTHAIGAGGDSEEGWHILVGVDEKTGWPITKTRRELGFET